MQPSSGYSLSGEFEGSYVCLGVAGGSEDWTPSAASWQRLSTTFTTGASQTSVTVYAHGWYGEGAHDADDLSLLGAAGSGSTTVDAALDCLSTGADCGSFVPPSTWPGVGGAMTWSINGDAANGYAFLDTVGPYLSSMS